MKESLEFEGKTIDEAIENACREMNLSRDKINVEILSEGSPGFLGIGAKKARIKAKPLFIDMELSDSIPEFGGETDHSRYVKGDQKGDDGLAAEARELTEGIVRRMGLDFPVTVKKEDDEYIIVEIEGDGSGILIGKGGQTLNALQYLINKALNKNGSARRRILIDTENYREKREMSLSALALKLGEKAKRTRKPVTVNPMNAHDRRIIHLALQDDKELVTKSRGEGALRKIVIVPSKKE